MTTEIADLIADADKVATILEDTVDHLHWMKRTVTDERRDDVLHAADRAGRAWAETRLLIATLRDLDTDKPTAEYEALLSTITPAGLPHMPIPPRSTPTPLELHQRGAL